MLALCIHLVACLTALLQLKRLCNLEWNTRINKNFVSWAHMERLVSDLFEDITPEFAQKLRKTTKSLSHKCPVSMTIKPDTFQLTAMRIPLTVPVCLLHNDSFRLYNLERYVDYWIMNSKKIVGRGHSSDDTERNHEKINSERRCLERRWTRHLDVHKVRSDATDMVTIS